MIKYDDQLPTSFTLKFFMVNEQRKIFKMQKKKYVWGIGLIHEAVFVKA